MKIAYHFNADHQNFNKRNYGLPIQKKFFSALLRYRTLNASTKIFIGDLSLTSLAMDIEKVENVWKETFNKEKYVKVVNLWLNTGSHIWRRFSHNNVKEAIRNNVFTICFENIDNTLAEFLHDELQEYSPYIGSIEVDDTSKVHWELYSHSLIPKYRLINKEIKLFWDGTNEASKDYSVLNFLGSIGFNNVEYESLEGKYSMFDKYHNFEHARKIAEWRKESSNFLAFMSDNVVTRLSDAAPELGNKLWAAYKTFGDAETNEQYAQVTASCRRIIEYVADSLFPPTDKTKAGVKLEHPHYKNRLLAYADNVRKSKTNIDVVAANTELLNEQIDKLLKLVNKGVHSEVFREEARRCLIRTIMLLDDFLSLKHDPFEIKAKLEIPKIDT